MPADHVYKRSRLPLRHEPRQIAQIPVIVFSAVADGEVPRAVATIRKATVNPDRLLRLIERTTTTGAH
jgi:hypothetical protein